MARIHSAFILCPNDKCGKPVAVVAPMQKGETTENLCFACNCTFVLGTTNEEESDDESDPEDD